MTKRVIFLSLILFCCSFLAKSQEDSLMAIVKESMRMRGESKYDSSLFLMQKLRSDSRDLGNFEFVSRATIEMSTTYIATKRYDFAYEMSLEAIEYAEISGNNTLKMQATYNIGMIKESKGDLDSAMFYYRSSERYYRDIGDSTNLGVVLSGIASVFHKKEEHLNAIDYNKEAIVFYMKTKEYKYLANRHFWIGENYLILDYLNERGQKRTFLDSAEFFYQQSVNWSDSLGFPVPHYKSLRGLAVVYQRRGDTEKALNYMYQSNDITQQLYSENIEDKLLDLRVRYKTAEIELENERKENELLIRKRSQTITLIIAISIVVAISIWLYVVDQRRKNIKAIAAKNDEINKQKIDELLQEQEIASLQGVLEGQETERKRVAIDLHDRLGGILSMVKLHFSSVEEKIDPDNPSKEKFLTASELLDLAAGEVRNISHNMMSGVLAKFGLIPALEDLQTRISETGKLKVNLYTSNVNGALDGEQELQLYRIVQELMSNILKHSEATETNIQLNENEDSVNLIVEDDGVGFNPEKLNVNAGIGLINLKARVAKLNGTLHIDSGLGSGTTISIDIPIDND